MGRTTAEAATERDGGEWVNVGLSTAHQAAARARARETCSRVHGFVAMRRAVLFAALVVIACGPVPMPKVPAVTTADGRACVQTCQLLYNQCMGAVGQDDIVVGGGPFAAGGAAGRRRNNINACRENLGGCYATCPT